jgi:hypothetical protein
MIRDNSKVLTSIPPKWEYQCPKCGCIEYGDCHAVDVYEPTVIEIPEVDKKYPLYRSQFKLETWLEDQTQKVYDGPISNKEVEIIKWDANPEYPVVALIDGIAFNFTKNGESQYGTSFTTLYLQENIPELTKLEETIFRELFDGELAIDNIPKAQKKAKEITAVLTETLPRWKKEPENGPLTQFTGTTNNRLYVKGWSISIPDLLLTLPKEQENGEDSTGI